MSTPALYCIYLPDEGPDPVDATSDYEESLALCRALVDEDGYARAEIRCGERVCCTADRDHVGRLRLRDAGADGGAARPAAAHVPTSRPAARRIWMHEDDVTHRVLAPQPADAPADGAAASPHPSSAARATAPERASVADGRGAPAADGAGPVRFLGEDPAGPPPRWLGL